MYTFLGVTCQEVIDDGDYYEIRGTASSSNQNNNDILDYQTPIVPTEDSTQKSEIFDTNTITEQNIQLTTSAFDLFGWSQPPRVTLNPFI